ncbi:MAG: hypothetical protein K6T65_14615 [Peptococcaceae bacterium]|nr:hypothetical protein [Peptococcaceae bacterium]
MQWYAVQVPTSHEKKVKKYIESRRLDGLAGRVGQVVIPEDKEGRRLMPGYIFLEADMWPEYYLMGCMSRCRVLGQVSEEEVMRMIGKAAARTEKKIVFRKGEKVMVTEGPFAGVEGIIQRYGSNRSKVSFFNKEVVLDVDNSSIRIAEAN